MGTNGMATATSRRQEFQAVEAQAVQLRAKLAEAERELTELRGEQTKAAEQIALDREKPEKINEISRKIEQTEARITGFKAVLAAKGDEMTAIAPAMRQAEAAELLADRTKKRDAVAAQGEQIVNRINAKVAALIQDLAEFDEVRDSLAREFGDLDGPAINARLYRVFLRENGSLVAEHRLIDKTLLGPMWKMRGDLILTIRNLWPPKK